MADVALEELSKTYPGNIRAVIDLTLRVPDGDLLVLVGPSGCGKTTTLRLLAGLEVPTRGLIRIAGRVVNAVPPRQRNLALVFQRPALYPHLSVRDNLLVGLELARSGWWFRRNGEPDRTERSRRVEQMASLLQLTGVLDRRPAELSGGQQQRVALGRALVRQPGLLLLDEPLSNLDARLRLEMRRELHLLQRQLRATMIYVTHDQEEALALGDRVALLAGGILQQVDTPAALYARPVNRLVAGFLGCPPMNLLDGTLCDQEGRLVLAGKRGRWAIPQARQSDWRRFVNQAVTVGVRAEHVRLRTPGPQEAGLVMRVELVERSGSESLVTLRQDDWQVTVRVPGRVSPVEHSLAAVDWEPWQPVLFDQVSGLVLSPARPEEADSG